jgi:ammonium transporter, Amt family
VEIDTGNTTWLLVSSALVLLMTPGLALFYGGLNRSKGVLNMMMMSFATIGLISVLWVLYGFSLAFGTNGSEGWQHVIGSFSQYTANVNFMEEIWLFGGAPIGIPTYVFMAFQMMFAIITVALISGAASDRLKFAGWMLFAFGWFTLVYIPVAHWIWGVGWINTDVQALDFAGGTAVHINAGAAALGLILVLGKRVGWPKDQFKPHNVPMVALGAGLLWFGWFGFNAGSELTADGLTAVAFVNTQVATAAGVLGWLLVERLRDGKPTLVGASSGAIAGLVAITPACGFITPFSAIIVGLVAGGVCALAVSLKYRFGYDDSLDVVAVHFVGGWIGSLSIGFFGTTQINSLMTDPASFNGAGEGLFYGGGLTQLGRQVLASGAVSIYSCLMAILIALAIKYTIGLRVKTEDEIDGIDVAEHAESGYDLSPASGGLALAGLTSRSSAKPAPAPTESSESESEKVAG